MAPSLQFNASWLHQESDGIARQAGSAGIATAPTSAAPPRSMTIDATPWAATARTDATGARQAEHAVVSELLQIARTVLTLEITFEADPTRPSAASVPAGTARLDTPIVLRDGQVYGRLCCVSDDRRTPVGSRPADALRCVAVLVGKELDRHRRRVASALASASATQAAGASPVAARHAIPLLRDRRREIVTARRFGAAVTEKRHFR